MSYYDDSYSNTPSFSRGLGTVFGKAAKAIGIGLIGLMVPTAVMNHVNSNREFDMIESQVRTLAEEGKLTNPTDSTPKPYTVKLNNGAEFAVNTTSALYTQNGNLVDSVGLGDQAGQQPGQPGVLAAIRSASSREQGYQLDVTISRLHGSNNLMRWFYNAGEEKNVMRDWGSKPTHAPLSKGQTPIMITPAPATQQ